MGENCTSELLFTLDDCQDVMDAAANQLSSGGYIDPVKLNATARQLAEYASQARMVIREALKVDKTMTKGGTE